MKDIKNLKLLYFKGLIFLLGGIIASVILIIEFPMFKTVLLLAAAIWCFARAYYFAFYVIEHYIDGYYKFSGLWSFFVYMLGRNKKKGDKTE